MDAQVIVLMGVCGSGKTVVGTKLAEAVRGTFADGDGFHPPENVAKMQGGTPLTDDDRRVWLASIATVIGQSLAGRGKPLPLIIACSALKKIYRQWLLAEAPPVASHNVVFVHLAGDEDLIHSRMAKRAGHFMPPTLLKSQFETLEPLADDERGFVVNIAEPIDTIVEVITSRLSLNAGAKTPAPAAQPGGTGVYVMAVDVHDHIVSAAYRKRGYTEEEATLATKLCRMAAWHGIKTHNALKAMHLDEMFGSFAGGCVPGAEITVLPTPFKAVQRWDANKKLGQAVAFKAMETCMRLADEYGVGVVSVDNAFHYLWGGGYVIDAAEKGYIAYTCCTSTLAEVVPFGGKTPTLGTNPHSWGFPTTAACGFPIVVDWATSVIAMGRVQQLKREGKSLPPQTAVDSEGRETQDPNQVAALLPFGAHKGYGLAVIDELMAAFGGGSLPTIRGRPSTGGAGDKHTANFYFHVVKPEAVAGLPALGRSQADNVKSVLDDIKAHGNEQCMLPGEVEHRAAVDSSKHNGLLFTAAEIEEFAKVALEAGVPFSVSDVVSVPL